MDVQYPNVGINTDVTINKIEELKSVEKCLKYDPPNDLQMTTSIVSVTSSLTSPVDSGVQLLDSESEIASVMSMSGTGDLDTIDIEKTKDSHKENNPDFDKSFEEKLSIPYHHNVMTKSDIANSNVSPLYEQVLYSSSAPITDSELKNLKNTQISDDISRIDINEEKHDISKDLCDANDLDISDTTSDVIDKVGGINDEEVDVDDHKIGCENDDNNYNNNGINLKDCEVPNDCGDVSEEIKQNISDDIPVKESIVESSGCGPEMHISMSEEVQESGLPTAFTLPVVDSTPDVGSDEQIVYRRQRKKRSSKSDTPKKRVSFHEDILNNTRTDDIHIEHGFITHPDISVSFFNWDSIRKKDVVKGRYSWAAEGDTPYYQRSEYEDTRQVHSEVYMPTEDTNRWSVTSSSSDSFDSGSSNSLNENEGEDNPIPKPKVPRSSCLKKRSSKRIETCIVQENTIGQSSTRSRRSESNLLDSNIFGSLKNILSLSTSVPLAERGVPEGQEDVSIYSSSQDVNQNRQQKPTLGNTKDGWFSNSLERQEKAPIETSRRNSGVFIEPVRSQLKLVPTEIVQTNTANPNVPSNIVLCDSTVYEHKGISYSYEYDKFQKSFETQTKAHKPKNSTIYQTLLRDLNFFKKREKELSENNLKALCSSPLPGSPSPAKENCPSKSDWSSDTTETVSDLCEVYQKHLASPKHRVKPNHYSVQNFKPDGAEKNDDSIKSTILKPATSKTSLINRFLRNVTMKKLLDAKLLKKQRSASNKCMGLYMKGVKPNQQLCEDIDRELEEEIERGKKIIIPIDKKLGSNYILKLKKEVFRDHSERLIGLYKVRSIYGSYGENNAMIVVLTDRTLYITGLKQNHTMSNLFVLPYTELSTILIGPDSHIIHFSNKDREMQYFVVTGSANITGELVSRLEMTIRRNKKKMELPAVRHLSMRDMARLRYDICQQTAVDKEEEYFHYSVVNVQEANNEPATTPLGPTKEGPLMFKTATDVRWQTGYFILKAGVLYMLSSPSNRVPMRALPLGGGACLGAHRTPYLLRPHTFELLLGTITLQLAAPDEYVASDWLQVLVQAASGLYGNQEPNQAQSCTLLLTSAHLLTMRESFPGNRNINTISDISDLKAQTLSCAAISDITSIRIPLAEQSWCILEFACREVHETSGDLVIYFATNTELERFLSNIEVLWSYNNKKGDSFPLNTISESETVNQKCSDTYRTLQTAWSTLVAPIID